MKIFPYHEFKIATPVSIEDSYTSLNSEIEPDKWFRFLSKHTLFQGTISRESFKITRIIHYRNSFLPIIYGTFLPGLNGTTVNIKMKMHPFVIAFMCFWFGGVGLGCFARVSNLLSSKALKPELLIPLGMLVFGVALVSGCFWFEVKQTIPILEKIFYRVKNV